LYQWFLTLLAAGWLSAVIGVSALFPVFGQWTPEFHCQTQLDEHFPTISFEERKDLLRQYCGSFGECSTTCDFMIPIDCLSANSSSLISSCLSDHELQFVTTDNSCSVFSFNYEALGVPKGHQNLIFSKGDPDAWETTVTDFAPICSRALVGTFMLSASIIGQTLGSFFVGIYSDRFGRKNAIFVFNIVFVISTIALALIRNEYSFIIMRIVMNFSSVIMYVAALTYGVELTGPSKRSLPGTFISIYFGLGYMGSSIVGYFIPHWQGHALAIGIMAALQLILTFFLPESPSFLVAKKRYKEACRVLEKIAVKTSSDVGADLEEKLKEIQEPQKADRSPLDLFRTSATRRGRKI
jgi:OCT family organic cation transporter-like MFS transporter 4/5